MRTSALLLPVVAVVCHGAALPVNVREPQQLGHVSRTVLIGRQDLGPVTRSFITPDVSTRSGDGLVPVVTRTYGEPAPVLTAPVEKREPQVLGSPSRTVILPTPPIFTLHPHPPPPHHTVAPNPPTSRVTYVDPVITRTAPVLEVPVDKREPQELGSPTRTVILPTPPVYTHHPHPHSCPTHITSAPIGRSTSYGGAGTTRTAPVLTVPVHAARNPQELGLPSGPFVWPTNIPRPTEWPTIVIPIVTRSASQDD
ncbi:uncharacterized protein BP5553_08888 [Venustampulla echinocandica]|uniref:Uncharacterized protein n=1 Tax=Venustampulla echinocandica TaxID=2656787 RepID=A0A370TDA1_9HELO|nr:uncharacterized protein BP5553_08888 [Venustampulla echinocandica]RDL32432.1 hypothetical protein BP5553_08888 [Venustampulla echinocandica]